MPLPTRLKALPPPVAGAGNRPLMWEESHGAQLTVKMKQPQPYFWGAFICQGDPGPLLPVWDYSESMELKRRMPAHPPVTISG